MARWARWGSSEAYVHSEHLNGLVSRLRTALDGLQIVDLDRFSPNAEVSHNLAHFTHDDHDLLNLPWDLAIGAAEHLCFSRGTTLRNKSELKDFVPKNAGPLRILVMVAAPETGGENGRLRYEDEQAQIEEAFGPLLRRGDIEIHFTADGSEAALRQALNAPGYDIFHFSGHSEYEVADWANPNAREGFVLLEDETSMAPRRLPASAFAALLNERPEKRPSLVFLSSCQSAQGSSGSGFTGVTGRLLEAGISGVVAMSHSVADVFATLFAAAFYRGISEGLSVPLAFSKALRISRSGNATLGLPPEFWVSQSLIPQLYLTQNLQMLTLPGTAKTQAGKPRAGNFWQTGRLREKLQKIHRFAGRDDRDFMFIGRRREQKAIRKFLDEAAPVFLRGQGGLGKTALAVHIAERLVLADPDEVQVFMFDENSFRIGQVTDELIDFLKNQQKQILLAYQIKNMDKAWEKFLTALQEVINRSKPVFIFDNLESLQADGGGDFRPEYGMEWDIITNLADMGLPLLLTGRYSLPELPNLGTVELHEPKRPDFAVKCRYLTISEKIPLGEAGKPVFETLFRSFGGNYRALEFFDTFYREKKEAFGEVLDTLEDFIRKHGAEPEVLAEMSENLVFERLLGLLDAPARTAMVLLAHFRRPVLPLAVEMQQPDLLEVAAQLERLSGLTLAEKTTDDLGNAFFYVPTLNRLLLERAGLEANDFSDHRAGEYYEYTDENINHLTLGDLEEAFFHFLRAENVEKTNKTGDRLSNFLYNNSQFQRALLVAGQTFETCGESTASDVLNRLGQIFHLFGKGDEALVFYEKNLKKTRETGDRKGEGATLNNLATTAHARGDYDSALRYLQQSLSIRQEIGDRKGEGTTLNNISQIYDARGDYDSALRYLQQSLSIQQEIGDRAGMCPTLHNMAMILLNQKEDMEGFLEKEQEAFQIALEIGNAEGIFSIGRVFGQVLCQNGAKERGLQILRLALQAGQQAGFPGTEKLEAAIQHFSQ